MKYDFGGWATRNDLLCSDGRTIRKNAFKNQNGGKVPLVWNHNHSDPNNVLGHAYLENRDEGVYAYCVFNDSESGKTAKELVKHGDVRSLSIFANNLKQTGGDVLHGVIREVSLVLAGANPGAFIDNVMTHGEEGEGVILGYDENITLYHSENKTDTEGEKKMPEATKKEKTVKDVFDEMTEEQQTVVYALIGQALESTNDDHDDDDDEEKGEPRMKHNLFDSDLSRNNQETLSHADQTSILNLAKSNSVGSLRTALEIYAEQNGADELAHGFDNIEYLFPEHKDVHPGAPELLTRDNDWVSKVMDKVHKSPFSRIRTRHADVRGKDLEAYGYKTGEKKKVAGNTKLLKRATDPQTVYRKDALNRDDIIDITDFDVVNYQYGIMKNLLEEEVALAMMVGDGRDDGDEQKIDPTHIRPIWHDDDLYTIHKDVDLVKAKAELQGTNTGMNFGQNYIFAEAIIAAALHSREQYKGTGTPDLYCTPHILNIMLLARDLNGRRIYNSKADLALALNVGDIQTVEQFEGLVRTDKQSKKKKLLGLFVNLKDYSIGATKGGEITKFNQFDIDFNQEKYLIETRLSGALTKAYSAIALELDVTNGDTMESVG